MKKNQSFQMFVNELFEGVLKEITITNGNYPPVNIIKIDNLKFKFEIGAIGFKKEDIRIELDPSQNLLIVTAKKENSDPFKDEQYFQRKLSKKNFVYNAVIPDYVEILAGSLEDGLLTIELEVKKPKEKDIKEFNL